MINPSDAREPAGTRFPRGSPIASPSPQRPSHQAWAAEDWEWRFRRRLYWWSFATRTAAALLAWYLTFVVELPVLQDARYYEEVGASIASDWSRGEAAQWLAYKRQTPQFEHLPLGLIYMVAGFYVLTGGVRALPMLLVLYSALTALSPVILYRTARLIGVSGRGARTAGWLVALSPAFIFFSGSLHKEGMILVTLGLSLYYAIRLQQRFQPRSFGILVLAVFFLTFLRSYLAVMMAFIVGLGLLLGRRRRREDPSEATARQFMIVGLFAAAVIAVGVIGQAKEFWPKGQDPDVESGLERMDDYRRGMATSAESGFLPEADLSTPGKALAFLPIGSVYFMVVPLPWQTGSMLQNVAIPDTFFWLLLYPIVFVGVYRAGRRNFQATALLVTALFGMIAFYGLTCGNIGTAYRMRIQVWFVMAIFFGIGWEVIRGRRPFEPRRPQLSLRQRRGG